MGSLRKNASCEWCMFAYLTDSKNDEMYECRKQPPRYVPYNEDTELEGRFPLVWGCDWCGEYLEDPVGNES